MSPRAVTPAGSAGAPVAVWVTLMSVLVERAPEGMTTFAPLASMTVPPAVPIPEGGGGAVPPPPSPLLPPQPTNVKHATIPALKVIRFMSIPRRAIGDAGNYEDPW